VLSVGPVSAQTTATWLNPVDGHWDNPANWDTVVFPNNGSPAAGVTYDVVIDVPGATNYVINIDTDIVIQSLTVGSSSAIPYLGGNGTLTLNGTLDLGGSTLEFGEGSLIDAQLINTGRLLSNKASSEFTLLTNIDVQGDYIFTGPPPPSSHKGFGVTGGMNIDGTANLAEKMGLASLETQSWTGTGQIILGDTSNIASVVGDLTLASGLTVRAGGSNCGVYAVDGTTLRNQGLILADLDPVSLSFSGSESAVSPNAINEGTLRVINSSAISFKRAENTGLIDVVDGYLSTDGNWVNNGTIRIGANGIAALGGDFTAADLVGIENTQGGKVFIRGNVSNAGQTLQLNAQTGPIDLGVDSSYNDGTITGGTIAASDGQRLNVGRGYLFGVTLDTDVSIDPSATLSIRDGVTSLNDKQITFNGGSTLSFNAYGSSQTAAGVTIVSNGPTSVTERLSNTGELVLDADSSIYTGTNGLRIGRTDSTIVNHGLISARTAGAAIEFTTAGLTNTGTIEARDGGKLIVPGALVNTGTLLAAPGGLVSLTGNMTTANLSGITNSGGEVAISGTLDNTSNTLTFDGTAGQWLLASGGRIADGRVEMVNGAVLKTSPTLGGGALMIDELAGGVEVVASTDLTIEGGIMFDTATIRLRDAAKLITFSQNNNPASLTGNGQIVLDATNPASIPRIIIHEQPLTIGPNILIRTGSSGGQIVPGNPSLAGPALALEGEVRAETPGVQLLVDAPTVNHGVMEVTNNGYLTARLIGDAGDVRLTDGRLHLNGVYAITQSVSVDPGDVLTLLGDWQVNAPINVNGGRVRLGDFIMADITNINVASGNIDIAQGFLDNTGQTLTVNQPTFDWRLEESAGITGGVIASTNGALLQIVTDEFDGSPSAAVLDGVHLMTDVQATNKHLMLQGAWDNDATINVAGGRLTMHGQFTTNDIGNLITTNATVEVTGNWDNSANNFTLNATTGDFTLLGGTISGGTLTPSGANLVFSNNSSNVLDGVTLDGNLVMNVGGGKARLQNGASFTDNAELDADSSQLIIEQDITLDNVTVNLDGQFAGFGISGTHTLTLGANALVNLNHRDAEIRSDMVRGISGTGSVVNHGYIVADNTVASFDDDRFIRPDAFDNQGTVRAQNGAQVMIFPGTLANLSAATLSGGRWHVTSGGWLALEAGSFDTNSAQIIISGAGSRFTVTKFHTPISDVLAMNAPSGTLRVLDNLDYPGTVAFTNAGELELGGGTFDAVNFDNQATGELFGFGRVNPRIDSTGTVRASGGRLVLANGLMGTGSTVIIEPGATLDFDGSDFIDTGAAFALTDGRLEGAANINIGIDLDQSGGTLAPGRFIGQTYIVGDYNLNAGSLEIELGGIDNPIDLATVTGDIDITTVGTTLDLHALGPMAAGTYTLLNTSGGTITGMFENIVSFNLFGVSVSVLNTGTAITVTLGSDLIFADPNLDGFVGIADLNILLSNWNQIVTPGDILSGDLNGDGFVGILDLNAVLGNWNAGAPPSSSNLPEPGSAAVLGIAVLLCGTGIRR
jgi:hypothetical protein